MSKSTQVDFEHEMKVNETFMRAMMGDVTLAAEIAEKQMDSSKTEWLVNRIGKNKEINGAFSGMEISESLKIAATEFAELLASERIEKRNETGFDDCNKHCGQAARIVANAVSDALG